MYTRIKADIKEAMKSKDTIKRNVLKMVVDKAKSIKKEQHPNDTLDTVPDDLIVTAINKEIKQLNQTINALKGKEDTDLYKETEAKISILNGYLPKMMTREEVEEALFNLFTINNYETFSLKMRAAMAELKGKADNRVIREVVEKYK